MTVVVKIGGADGNRSGPLLDELAAHPDHVLVHGGSAEVDRLAAALGRPAQYYTSPSGVVSRRCDAAQLEAVVLALAGKVQTELVAALGARGAPAVGLSGVDGGLLRARRRTGARACVDGRVVRLADDRSGTIEAVHLPLLAAVRAAGLLPVIGPPAVTPEGEVVNVDADRVAAAVAVALGAEALVLLTNVGGLLAAPDDPGSRIPRVAVAELERVLPIAGGRMKKKLLAAREAVTGGVPRAIIAPSAVPAPIAAALAGGGTEIA